MKAAAFEPHRQAEEAWDLYVSTWLAWLESRIEAQASKGRFSVCIDFTSRPTLWFAEWNHVDKLRQACREVLEKMGYRVDCRDDDRGSFDVFWC